MRVPPIVATPDEAANAGLEFKHLRSLDSDAPILYLVHGRAGHYDNMWAFRRCVPEGVTIVTPQAPLQDAIGGWSWWNVPRTQSFATEVDESVVKLQSFISRYETQAGLQPRRRFACGFSQGAAMLSQLLQRNPANFGGIALLAGFVMPMDFVIPTEPLPPVFIAHGTRDEIVTLEKSREGQAYLESLGFAVERVEDEVGHKVGVQGMRQLGEWLVKIGCH